MEEIYDRLEELNSDSDIMGIYDYKIVEEEAKEEEIEKARLKGIEYGQKIGFDNGQKIGFNNGFDKGIIETAKNMLKENIDLNIISKVTKLSKEELEKLK